MSNDQFRALEEISGSRDLSRTTAGNIKADDLLAAAISAYAAITRPGRQDTQQLEDLALPMLRSATPHGKRHVANALALLDDAPRRLLLTLASEPTEISAPLLLRSPLLQSSDLIDLIGRKGLGHARVIARRPSRDPLLRQVLTSFADPAIERTLAMQDELADKSDDMPAAIAEQESTPASLPVFSEMDFPTESDLIVDAALLGSDAPFRKVLADALDLTLERVEMIIGKWPQTHLPIALKALGFTAAECFLTLTAVLGSVETDREGLRNFVKLYRSIDRQKATALIRRWRAEDMSAMLRDKLREMATSALSAPVTQVANSDHPLRSGIGQ